MRPFAEARDRDDFNKLDDLSFEKCLQILEEYEATRLKIETLLGNLKTPPDAATFDHVRDAIEFCGLTPKNKLRLSILKQLREEHGVDEEGES